MGFVTDLENDNNPSMEIFANRDGLAYLSLNDMEIIQDNWNMLLEGIENKGVKKNNEKVVDKNKEFWESDPRLNEQAINASSQPKTDS